MNNLGRGPLGEAMYQISKAWPSAFRQEDFQSFSLYGSMKNK